MEQPVRKYKRAANWSSRSKLVQQHKSKGTGHTYNLYALLVGLFDEHCSTLSLVCEDCNAWSQQEEHANKLLHLLQP